jgi:hypothetical protein
MKKINLALLIFVSTLFSGCAFGPLVTHETARTVGYHNNDIIVGYGVPGYVVKWSFGLLEDLDLGVQFESLSVGARLKYSFINNQKGGWSLATALGAGSSVGGNHYYGDVMGSYLSGSWEPYSTLRIVHIKTDPTEFRSKDTNGLSFTVNSFDYDYGQFFLGTRYWISEHWIFSIEASTLFSITSGLKVGSNIMGGAAFGYHF